MISSQSASHLWLLNSLLFSCQIFMMITQDYVYWILVGWMHGCLMNGFWLSALTRNVKKIINLSSEVPEIILYYYYLIFFSSNTHTSAQLHRQTHLHTAHCFFLSSWCHFLFYFSLCKLRRWSHSACYPSRCLIYCLYASVCIFMWRSINCNYTSKYMLYVDWRTRSARITGAVQVITDLMNCYKFLIISWAHKYQVVKPYLPYSSKTVYYRSQFACRRP